MNDRKKFEISEHKKVLLSMFPICQICNTRQSTELHHLLPQVDLYKKLYYDYIHRYENILCVCKNCHDNKAFHISEIEFCLMFNITPRSKSGLWKYRNDNRSKMSLVS
jgi:hypothetical protein